MRRSIGPTDPTDPTDPPAAAESVARAICLRLLTVRPRTRAELAEALRRRNVPEEAAQSILDRLGSVGLIDDAAFAAVWVNSRHAGRGLAGAALAAELRARGVAAGTVADAVGALDPQTQEATARRLVDRRLSGGGSARVDVQLRRLMSMLCRKGYPVSLAGKVVREALADRADGDDMEILEPVVDGRSPVGLTGPRHSHNLVATEE